MGYGSSTYILFVYIYNINVILVIVAGYRFIYIVVGPT